MTQEEGETQTGGRFIQIGRIKRVVGSLMEIGSWDAETRCFRTTSFSGAMSLRCNFGDFINKSKLNTCSNSEDTSVDLRRQQRLAQLFQSYKAFNVTG